MANPHARTAEEVLAELGTSHHGLTPEEAARRLAEYGANVLQAARRVSPWRVLGAQFGNVLIIILLLACVLSACLGHGVEAILITVIVLLAVLLGFIQEYRAERAIEALRQMAAPTATVLRQGEEVKIPAWELVPGDILFLRVGDKVAADVRLIEAVNLQIEEAALTGESAPVEKQTGALPGSDIPLGDRTNMAYAGTVVTYGRGRGVVVATGIQTEFGRIAQLLQSVETTRTPLQQNLDRVGHVLARASLVIVVLVVALGLLRGEPFVKMLVFGIALAVAVVPEALPAVVTISLAIGVRRMVKRHALIRRLPAVETLGSTTVICSDKTGTLTKDEMTARRIFVAGRVFEISGAGYEPVGAFSPPATDESLSQLLRAAALASDAYVVYDESTRRWDVRGDPTEGALVVAAAKAGLKKAELDEEFPRTDEIPFTSESKRMTTIHRTPQGSVAYSKGAPEVVLSACTLAAPEREAVLEAARHMAGDALRVLAVAMKPAAGRDTAEHDMTFLGLVGMIDPPRPEAAAAVQKCREAGIRVVMITGDHPTTARAVARELGILAAGRVVTGVELEKMDDAEFAREVESIDVYARVSPEHKLRVVSALQKRGHVVAMTGDGVNDAPTLKKADIGIAMGITGTDVTKEASSMTLTDDNFASIVAAVEEGRGVFGNIKKFLAFLLSCNVGEVGLMAGAALLGLPLPLSAVQILYVNLATDGLPALALAVDPPEKDLMRRPPRPPSEGIFTRPVVVLMALGGLWTTLASLGLFAWQVQAGRQVEEAMTMAFAVLVLVQFFNAFNFRSDRHSALSRPFANRWLNLAVVSETLMLVAVVTVPSLEKAFGLRPLAWADWLLVTAAAAAVVPVIEVGKWLQRRRQGADLRS
jgi:P-type Ca2+ transporter type 2C